jgi:YVTN family beta-propeller protein
LETAITPNETEAHVMNYSSNNVSVINTTTNTVAADVYVGSYPTAFWHFISQNQILPTINWTNPANITYGTPLSNIHLDATASVPGTFVYIPPLGTVLDKGTQTLSTTFTPTDSINYTTALATVLITVVPEQPIIIPDQPFVIHTHQHSDRDDNDGPEKSGPYNGDYGNAIIPARTLFGSDPIPMLFGREPYEHNSVLDSRPFSIAEVPNSDYKGSTANIFSSKYSKAKLSDSKANACLRKYNQTKHSKHHGKKIIKSKSHKK